ncbi:MAG: CoA pyrophosphatase [Chloroflexi bacterium]|nr:CoA pyrophosphatase [Chloroflexota bacterium]
MLEAARLALASHRPQALPLGDRRESAVMLLLYPREGATYVLFQVRTHRVAHHRGEISLPGGARDPHDPSLEATALRETHEEVGIAPEHVEVLGRLDDTMTRSSPYRITPFVGALRDGAPRDAGVRAARELSEVLYVPLDHLLSVESRAWKVVEDGGLPSATPAYLHGAHLIWGATARIVTQFVSLLGGAPHGEPSR